MLEIWTLIAEIIIFTIYRIKVDQEQVATQKFINFFCHYITSSKGQYQDQGNHKSCLSLRTSGHSNVINFFQSAHLSVSQCPQ